MEGPKKKCKNKQAPIRFFPYTARCGFVSSSFLTSLLFVTVRYQ